jgi:acyl carrier protein
MQRVSPAPASAVVSAEQAAFERELGRLIVEVINLDIDPGQIDPAAPLFGEGLGLDSIDLLEIALAVSQKYGFSLRSDDPDNRRIFSSLRHLSAHIAEHRAK